MAALGYALSLLVIFIALAPANAKPPTHAAARKAIQAAYDKMDQAAGRKDMDAFLAFYTPDLVTYTEDGLKHNRSDLANNMKLAFASASSLQATTTIQTLKVSGDTVVVVSVTHTKIVLRNPSTGETISGTEDETDRDTWVQSGGAWKIKEEHVLSDHTAPATSPAPDIS